MAALYMQGRVVPITIAIHPCAIFEMKKRSLRRLFKKRKRPERKVEIKEWHTEALNM